MDFSEILQRRTIRFFEQRPVPESAFRQLIDAARRASCGANTQQLRYQVIRDPELVAAIFPFTAYAARVKPGRDPIPGKTAPPAFIAVLATPPDRKTLHADAGAAIQSIEFAAWNLGIGCCWIGAFQEPEVRRVLALPDDRLLLYLVAVGYPAEQPVMEDIPENGNVAYYLDEARVLHVPKFTVDAITTGR